MHHRRGSRRRASVRLHPTTRSPAVPTTNWRAPLGIGYDGYGRHLAEVLVDTVTFVVCAGVGLDVSGDSVPYVPDWGDDDAVGAVTRFAETIDRVARRIERALHSDVLSGDAVAAVGR